MGTKEKPIVFKNFADLKQVRNKFIESQSLESVTDEMAGKEEYSNTDGESDVDSLYNSYMKSLQELETLDVNIADKIEYIAELESELKTIKPILTEDNPEYKRISDSLDAHIKARTGHIEGSYKWNTETPIINQLTADLNNTPKTLTFANKSYDMKKYQINTAKGELSSLKSKRNPLSLSVTKYKNEYSAAKIRYDNDVARQKAIDASNSAKQAEIDLAAYDVQKKLEAEASAKNIEKQKDFEIEKEKSAIIKAEKSAKMKKIAIYGGVALTIIVLSYVGYKKGVFKIA